MKNHQSTLRTILGISAGGSVGRVLSYEAGTMLARVEVRGSVRLLRMPLAVSVGAEVVVDANGQVVGSASDSAARMEI